MPIGKKFGTNAAKQIWAITYFTLALSFKGYILLDLPCNYGYFIKFSNHTLSFTIKF